MYASCAFITSLTCATPRRPATRGIRSLPNVVEGPSRCVYSPASATTCGASAAASACALAAFATVRTRVKLIGRDLRTQGYEIADYVPLGAMIEVPAAAIALPGYIGKLDFLSIGTNDLVQYLLAADRNNEALAELYTPLHPAVIRLVRDVIRLAHAHGKSVAVCGEMAGDPAYTLLLLGMGLRNFSMHPGHILEIKRQVLRADLNELAPRVQRILKMDEQAKVREAVMRLAG